MRIAVRYSGLYSLSFDISRTWADVECFSTGDLKYLRMQVCSTCIHYVRYTHV